METYRRLVVRTIIVFVILLVLIVFAIYEAWTNYSSFHNFVIDHLTWDWYYFNFMIFWVFLAGLFSGMLFFGIYFVKQERADYLKALERQKLKEEIKKELEMEKEKA